MHLPRRSWVWLNYLRTGIPTQLGNGSICVMRQWRRGSNGRAHTVVAHCPLFSPLHGITGLVRLDDDTITWLHESCSDAYFRMVAQKIYTLLFGDVIG